MKRISVFFSILFLALAISASENEFGIGSTVENFKLADLNGATKSFNDMKGEKGTIVVFVSAQCPVVKGYNDRMNALAADFKAKGINFFGINSNESEYNAQNFAWMKDHHEKNYKFPVLIDKGNVIADKWGASFTPEMFLFDRDGKLIYHGAIDNDRSGTNVKATYLRDALNEHLDGKVITNATTKAFGCTIKRKS